MLQMMQFMLAADRLVGDFFSPELLQELDPSLRGGRQEDRRRGSIRGSQQRQDATMSADAGSGSHPDTGS